MKTNRLNSGKKYFYEYLTNYIYLIYPLWDHQSIDEIYGWYYLMRRDTKCMKNVRHIIKINENLRIAKYKQYMKCI